MVLRYWGFLFQYILCIIVNSKGEFQQNHQKSVTGRYWPQMLRIMSSVRSIISRNVDPKLLCPKCKQVLEFPRQTECGHRYDRDCLGGICRDGKGICIVEDCNEEFQADECFPDKAIEKEVMNMRLDCPFKDTGCDWSGRYRDLQEHLIDCKGEELCIDCKEKVKIVKVAEHRTSTCKNKRVPCLFEKIGCQFRPTEEDKEKHIQAEWFSHLSLILSFLFNLHNLASKSITENGKKSSKDSGNAGATGGAAVPENKEVHPQIKQKNDTILEKKVETIEGIMSVLHREVESLSSGLTDDVNSKKATEEVNRLREELRTKDATIAAMSLKIDELRLTSYDRRLIWKITDCKQKMQEAKSKRVLSFFSPPFFTEPNGYKMCGRIYMNGDGMGKGTHVSLFFVVCRGANDSILSWPFRQKVTFTMVSQNKKEHIVDAFRTDPSSSSFKRPVAEMNTASGCPLFATLSDVLDPEKGYIKDDTMFIQIKVEGDSGMII